MPMWNEGMPGPGALLAGWCVASERFEVERQMAADPPTIYRLLCDPQGHVAIDSSGMLMAATGDPVDAVGDTFVVHMDREALNDRPMGRYNVVVTILELVTDRRIAWTVAGETRPSAGHVFGYTLDGSDDGTLVTSFYDWSSIDPALKETGIFPVLSEAALRATLGILARTVESTGPDGST
jgi:hypothetical protein